MKPLFKHQSQLPKLPVPSLEETLDRYLKSVHFLLSDAQFQQTTKVVNDFKNGIGKELQRRLVARAESSQSSWLIDWWNDYAYMSYRDPVVINVNYFFGNHITFQFLQVNSISR